MIDTAKKTGDFIFYVARLENYIRGGFPGDWVRDNHTIWTSKIEATSDATLRIAKRNRALAAKKDPGGTTPDGVRTGTETP